MLANKEWYRKLTGGRWLCVFFDYDKQQNKIWIRPQRLDKSKNTVTADRQY